MIFTSERIEFSLILLNLPDGHPIPWKSARYESAGIEG